MFLDIVCVRRGGGGSACVGNCGRKAFDGISVLIGVTSRQSGISFFRKQFLQLLRVHRDMNRSNRRPCMPVSVSNLDNFTVNHHPCYA